MEAPPLAWRPWATRIATLAVLSALVYAGTAAAGEPDDGPPTPCTGGTPAAGCLPGPAQDGPDPLPLPGAGADSLPLPGAGADSLHEDPSDLLGDALVYAGDAAGWAQTYPNATFAALLYMLQSEDDRDQGQYPRFHANETQRGADLALRPAGREARYPEGTPAYGGENVVNGSTGRLHRHQLAWNTAYALLDGEAQPVPATTVTESAVVDDCNPHPPIDVVGEVGDRGLVLGRDPVAGLPVYRPGSGVVAGSGTGDDPYVIEGWCVNRATDPGNAGASIRIASTDAHVVIRGNHLDDHHAGIRVEDASNVTVAGNEIHQHTLGIRVRDGSHDVEVRGNLVDVSFSGIGIGGANNTVRGNVVGPTTHAGIAVSGDDHLVEGNAVAGSGRAGIRVHSFTAGAHHGNAILDNRVHGTESPGIWLRGTEGTAVEGNVVTGTTGDHPGITTRYGDADVLRNNTLADNGGPGIENPFGGRDHRFVGNAFSGNGGPDLDLASDSQGYEVRDNAFSGSGRAIDGGGWDHVVDGNDVVGGHGIALGGGHHTVTNNTLEEGTQGFVLRGPHHLVANNTVNGSAAGLALVDGHHLEVRDNALRGNDGTGIELRDLDDSLVAGNLAVGNHDGVFLKGAHGNVVRGNHIEASHRWGATLWDGSTGNLLGDNTVVESTWDGIDLRQESDDNTLRGNVLRNNSQDGVSIRSSANTTVAGNHVSGNGDAGLRVHSVPDPVDARGNWWGAETGPSGGVVDACTGTAADGDGDPIRVTDGAACFDPWETAPP